MSEEEGRVQPEPRAAAEPVAETLAEEAAPAGETPVIGETPMAELERRIADLERRLANEHDSATDYMARWQRIQADFSNFRRRVQQEQEQRGRLLAAQAASLVLPALDSFERAFAALPPTLREFSWIDGVALVHAQLRQALDGLGIQPVAAEPGQPFDPTRHEAIGEIETAEYPSGHIAVLVQRGYEVAGLLLRPALVQVARVPRPAAPEALEPAGEGPPAEKMAGATPGPGP